MGRVKKEGIILTKTQLGFEMEGVLNPAIMQEDSTVHLFYRAVGKGNFSSIGYCKLNGPMEVTFRNGTPIIFPQHPYECHGVEDPRIVQIEGLYYLTYVAYDGVNALGALALSSDMIHFEKMGIIVPQISYEEFKHLAACQGELDEKYSRYNSHNHLLTISSKNIFVWDKNVIFFPRRIHGKLYFLHRIKPDIQLACVGELVELNKEFWDNYFLNLADHVLLTPRFKHEVSYIGGGAPPIETKEGWIMIYHGVHDTTKGYVYSVCAALLDLDNPFLEVSRLPYPLFRPELEWELKGEVNNVCFPTGTSLFGDTLYIYYGAADERIAAASLSISALIEELLFYKFSTNENRITANKTK